MSVALREKLEKRNVAITAARALSEKAETEKRAMNADEARQYDAHMAEAVTLRESIDREQKLIEEEKRELGQKIETEQRGKQTPDAEARSAAFRRLLTLDVANGDRLSAEEYRTLTAGQDTAAGFLTTPQEFVQQLIARVKDQVFVRSMATVISTNNANGLGFPTLEADPDDAEWSTEIKIAPEDTALKFGKRELKPHPMKKLIKASDKLLRADGINPESVLLDRAGYKIGITEEKAYFLGSGNQQPLGLFTPSAQGINTDRDVASGSATGFSADGLKLIKYSLKAQYMTTACWLFHRDGVAKIATLKDGNGQYIFEMAEALGAKDTLMGRPLCMSEYVPNTFTTGKYVGMFCDMKWYYIADSLALRIKRLNELFALTGEVGFIFDKETDGMPVLPEAFARIKTN